MIWLYIVLGICVAFIVATMIVLIYDACSEKSYRKYKMKEKIITLDIRVTDLQSRVAQLEKKEKKKTTK